MPSLPIKLQVVSMLGLCSMMVLLPIGISGIRLEFGMKRSYRLTSEENSGSRQAGWRGTGADNWS